jgi:hypothetical protein
VLKEHGAYGTLACDLVHWQQQCSAHLFSANVW